MRIDAFYHSIENSFNGLRLVITAYNKREDTYFDYMRIYEDGHRECRNLYLSCCGGYSVTFPGAYARSIYGERNNGRYIQEEWNECNYNHVGHESRGNDHSEDINVILRKYPEFIYTLKKWRGKYYYIANDLSKIVEALRIWIKHKEVEFMLGSGLDNLVFSVGFWKLTEKKRKELVKRAIQNVFFKGLTLRQLQNIVKHDMTLEEFEDYEKGKCYSAVMSVDTYRYLQKKKLLNYDGYNLYMDYRKMAKSAGHNLKEDYWNHPANLEKAHVKVLAEVNAQRIAQLRIDNPDEFCKLDKIAEKLSVFNSLIGNYEILITSDLNEWQRQADTLHQCIIRCAYYKKVARGEEILVFIKKSGLPIATAEILPGNRIGQFYANECSGRPEGSRPSQEVRDILNAWLLDKPDLLEYSKETA
jgi:hypothetical protein